MLTHTRLTYATLTYSAKSHSQVYNDDYKNTPWYARNFDMEMQTHTEGNEDNKQQRVTHARTHTYNHSLGKSVERVHALYYFIRDVQSLYLMQAGGGSNFCASVCMCVKMGFNTHVNVCAHTLIIYMDMHVCFIFIRGYICMRLLVCVLVQCDTPPSCLPDSTYSPFTLLCSLSPPPSSSFSSPPPISLSLCPAGTYMHVCRLCTVLAAVARANLTAMQPCVH